MLASVAHPELQPDSGLGSTRSVRAGLKNLNRAIARGLVVRLSARQTRIFHQRLNRPGRRGVPLALCIFIAKFFAKSSIVFSVRSGSNAEYSTSSYIFPSVS